MKYMNEFKFDYFVIQFFLPEEDTDEMIAALQMVDPLIISVSTVTNYYKKYLGKVGFPEAKPTLGEFIKKKESKIEVKIHAKKLGYTIHKILEYHTYEAVHLSVIPLV